VTGKKPTYSMFSNLKEGTQLMSIYQDNYQPYFYIIQDVRNGMYYVGAKWGKDANPSNFMIEGGYETSSEIIKELIRQHGLNNFIIRKIRIFETGPEAHHYEKRFLEKVDAKRNKRFYNKHNNDHVFTYHDDRYKEKMIEIYGVEYPYHSPDLAEKVKRNNLEKYGVENVFQAEHVKDKIKETNMERYGVEHPSYSNELLEKKAQNNLEKYGVRHTLFLPHIREKALENTWTEKARQKRTNTNLEKYGVEVASSSPVVIEKVLETREKLSNRKSVILLREYTRYFRIKLGEGWYQKTDEWLEKTLTEIQEKYGYYDYEELSKMVPEKKYSASIKLLQERPLVKELRKYKEKYGRELKLGRVWDRKSDEYLEKLLSEVIEKYGKI
jgi:hypothetical protein